MALTYRHVTVAGGGGAPNDGETWANAFSMAQFIADYEGNGATGRYYFFKPGNYTMGEDVWGQVDGTAAEPIRIISVKDATSNEGANIVSSDWETGATRTVFIMGAFYFGTRDYHQTFNISGTGTDNNIFYSESYNILKNCKADNSDGVGNRDAFYTTGYTTYVSCEGISDIGYAFSAPAADYCRFLFCHAHNSDTGFEISNFTSIFGCVAADCSDYGIQVDDQGACAIANNSIYNCGTGIYGTTGGANVIINNALDENTTGANWTTVTPSNFWGYNIWDNDTDRANVTSLIGGVDADPGFNDPGSGGDHDYTIADGDNADDVGLDVGDETRAII